MSAIRNGSHRVLSISAKRGLRVDQCRPPPTLCFDLQYTAGVRYPRVRTSYGVFTLPHTSRQTSRNNHRQYTTTPNTSSGNAVEKDLVASKESEKEECMGQEQGFLGC